jgi:hypothetical protein
MSVVDLVIDVVQTDVVGAATWLAQNFAVRRIPKRKHLEPRAKDRWFEDGREQPIELLVKSGIWATLSAPTRGIAPVLLALATRNESDRDTFSVTISCSGIARYSGVKSFSSISKGLGELHEIGWLESASGGAFVGPGPFRETNTYVLRPWSDAITELANAMASQNRQEIEAERQLRKLRRRERQQALNAATRCVAMEPTPHAPPHRYY